MTFKKLIAVCLSALIAVVFSGCASFDVQNLLLAPKLEGDMYPVQQALEDAVGDSITLKYPISGEYRSSFVLKDLNGNGSEEAIALYSVTTDNTVTMHINVIAETGDKWESQGDLSVVGNDVESISFSDLDGDGNLEIVVGWMIFGLVDKQVGVYSFGEGGLVQRAMEKYTNFTSVDLNNDNVNDLAIIYLNSTEKTALARVFAFNKSGINEIGSVGLDGGVSSYSEPVLSKLVDTTPALYIDAVKGSGTLTEIIWFDDGKLHSLYDTEKQETFATYRASSVSAYDFNADGVLDIPLLEILESTAELNDADKVYYTNWTSFGKTDSKTLASTFMNYTDGYCITVPEKWKSKLYLTRKIESRLRVFYSFEPATKTYGDELFSIKAVATADYDGEKYEKDGYTRLEQNEGIVYLVKVANGNDLNITEQSVKEIFSIIK